MTIRTRPSLMALAYAAVVMFVATNTGRTNPVPKDPCPSCECKNWDRFADHVQDPSDETKNIDTYWEYGKLDAFGEWSVHESANSKTVFDGKTLGVYSPSCSTGEAVAVKDAEGQFILILLRESKKGSRKCPPGAYNAGTKIDAKDFAEPKTDYYEELFKAQCKKIE
jgi:hypothetical protein